MANEPQYKQGRDWAQKHPNQPAPPNSPQDFQNGVKDQNKKKP